MNKYYYSKQNIRQRMFQHAASFWGVRAMDDLDPIVLLLIESLASEIYTVNNTIQDSQNRILESIASLLTPSVHTFPSPAHAIAQANAIEPRYFLDKNTVFQDKNLPQEIAAQGISSLKFVPVTDIRLISGNIKYLICERMLFHIENDGEKTLLSHAQTLDERINHTVWIGLSIDPQVETLKGVSFYFDFPHTDSKHEKFSLLPYTKWSYKGRAIELHSGLPILDKDYDKYRNKKSILYKYELQNQIDEHILDLYKNQFLTIESDLKLAEMEAETFPEQMKEIFLEKSIAALNPCYWLKVTFPPHILATNLHDLAVSLNAFPIVNKIPKSIVSTPSDLTTIIPLHAEDKQYFLSINKVSDSHNHEYTSVPYTTNSMESGVYTLKQGGLERFDKREAKTYLERLLDLLRSESISFSSMEMDNFRNIVTELEQNIRDIEVKYRNSKMETLETPYYLLINTINPNDIVYVDYWLTNCSYANGIRSGKSLAPETFIPIDVNGCRLLKITSGGKAAPSTTGRLNAYRYALTSHDSIMTNKNIIDFFKMELGDNLMKVEVKKGVGVSSKPKEGLIRTTDIYVSVIPDYTETIKDMKDDLLTTLISKSPDIYNFRLIIH